MATVSTSTGTYLSNLFDPQVIGQMINEKLFDAIKFAPLATVFNDLEARPGSTILLPYYESIGDATDVAEGADIAISQLSEKTKEVKIKKAGKGVQITDEAILSGYGDPIGQAAMQLAMSIASKVDNDILATLNGNTKHVKALTKSMTADDIADALVEYGEDIEGEKVIVVNATAYATLRKANAWIPNTEIGANMIIHGTVGMVHGCQVVVSNRIKEVSKVSNFHIVKPGALAIYSKRDVLVEKDRDIINKSTIITADKHYATYLQRPDYAIKVTQTLS